MDELLADFLIESDERLAEAERAIFQLERAPEDRAALSLAFRLVHTIKGTCGFLGLPRLEQLLHSAEGVLGQVRDGALPVTPNLVTGVRRTLDHARLVVAGLNAAGPGLAHPASGLQDGDVRSRRQPIGQAWARLPRLVRRLSRELGKQIELVMYGLDTELDRDLLGLIGDAVTHLARNSADHGIETPAERAAMGKPERGRIMLGASNEGGHILIEFSDDGRGLAMDRIRAEALRSGLAAEAELSAMSDARVQRFVFHAGFSTASAVTLISGRGVGLDVVRTSIEQVRGTTGLSSRAGHGTTITIRIPNAPAMVPALAGTGTAGQPRLLVVDDSCLFRQLLLPALSASGFAATAAGSVEEALVLLDAGLPYDAIISDIEMPDIDGLAFAQQLRSSSRAGVPMVALSGRSGAADVEAALAAGFTEHVTKFECDELVMALRRCLAA